MLRLLDLSLFGNARAEAKSVNRRMKLGSVTVRNKTKNLFPRLRLEGDRQKSLDRHRAAVHGVGLEFPLLHSVDGGFGLV